LTGTCGIDSLDEITCLEGIDSVDTTIKGVTNPGGTVMIGSETTEVTSHNNGIHVSVRAVDNLKLCVYYLKHMERVQLLIPQLRPARKYSISRWEMIHLPREIAQ
jgi:hypothetical protein